MNLMDMKSNPSTRERNALGLALCALGGVVAWMIWLKPESLVVFAIVTGLAWCASMLFNRDEPLSRQSKGVFVPLIAGLLYAACRLGDSPGTIAVAEAVAFAALGFSVFFRDRFGNRFYETWSLLFLPLAWCVSTLLLVLVYYGVIAPIGLALRIIGRDPLQREFDREASSYWVKREEPESLDRYFRQY